MAHISLWNQYNFVFRNSILQSTHSKSINSYLLVVCIATVLCRKPGHLLHSHLVAAPWWEVGSGDPRYTVLDKTPNPEPAPQTVLSWSLTTGPGWAANLSCNKQGVVLEIWTKSERVKLASLGWKPQEVLTAREKKGAEVHEEKSRGEGRWGTVKSLQCLIWLAPSCLPDPGFHEIPPRTRKEFPPWLKLVEVYLTQVGVESQHKIR